MKNEKEDSDSKKQSLPPRLLSEIQAAEYLAVSRSQVRAFVRAGVLRPVWLPHQSGVGVINRVLYDIHDLDRFIDGCKREEPANNLPDRSSAA